MQEQAHETIGRQAAGSAHYVPPVLASSISVQDADAVDSRASSTNDNTQVGCAYLRRYELPQILSELVRTSRQQRGDLETYIFDIAVLDAFYGDNDNVFGERAALITLMLYTRDIVDGWGEYGLFYTLVMRFDQCIDEKEHYVSKQKTETMRVILHNIIASCVCVNGHGSWKDMKYLLNCLRETHGEVTASQK